MKFAKVLERTLIEDDIPEEWLSAAIQYKALKKCISKVVDELEFLGLKQDTLKVLLQDASSTQVVEVDEKETNPGNPVIAEYTLTRGSLSDKLQPMLKIVLDYSNENYTDDHIYELGMELKNRIERLLDSEDDYGITSPDENEKAEPKNKIEMLDEDNSSITSTILANGNEKELNTLRGDDGSIAELAGDIDQMKVVELKGEGDQMKVISPTVSHNITSSLGNRKNEILITLNSDKKFFRMLDKELDNLDLLRMSEENKLITEVEEIGNQISKLTSPKVKLKNSDMYKWRELFKIYLDSEVYFKYNETSVSSRERDSEHIKKNLAEFLNNVEKSGILTKFKAKASTSIFENFVAMNYHLLKVCQFQQINSEAFRKILKKFDKQTALGVSLRFPKIMATNHVFVSTGRSMAQNICFVIQSSLLTLIPQLDDYTCPICMSIAFKPIRLECGHVFCVRCLVKMKQDSKTDCPMCRNKDAIVKAHGGNLDLQTMELMKKYFPIEVKQKLKERDKEKYDQIKRSDEKCEII